MKKILENLTVFVISTGEDINYPDCIKALSQQTVDFKQDVVLGYSPMSAAFQQMLDRCTTEYFIQVDEDMILEPGAVEALYDSIVNQTKHAMVCFYLDDVYTAKPVQGIKIYNHTVFKKFPYDFKNLSCEVEQLARLKTAGHSFFIDSKVLGKHSPKHTPKSIFLRNYTNVRKQRYFKSQWGFGDLYSTSMKKLQETLNGENLFGFLGVVAGGQSDMSNFNQEKSFKDVNQYFESLALTFPELAQYGAAKPSATKLPRKVKVVQLARIPCANSGYYLSQLLNVYSNTFESRYVLGEEYSTARPKDVPFRKFPIDLYWQTQKEECIQIIKDADIVHIHHDFWANNPEIKSLLVGKRVIVTVYDLSLADNKAYIEAQKALNPIYLTVGDQPAQRRVFGHLTDKFVPLVNCLFNEPERKVNPVPVIVYAPTNRYPITNSSSKGYAEVIAIINDLREVERLKFEFDLVEGVSHEEDLKHKRRADIIIDDVVNKTWHNTSLHAACFGAISLTGHSSPEYPFIETNLGNLQNTLRQYISHPGMLIAAKAVLRTWRETYYTPQVLLKKVEDIYTAALKTKPVPVAELKPVAETVETQTLDQIWDMCTKNETHICFMGKTCVQVVKESDLLAPLELAFSKPLETGIPGVKVHPWPKQVKEWSFAGKKFHVPYPVLSYLETAFGATWRTRCIK